MIKLSITFACFNLAIASDPWTIRVPRGAYRFPVEYATAHGNGTFNGYGWIDFGQPTFAIQHTRYDNPDRRSNADLQEAQSLRIVDSETRVEFAEPTLIYRESSTRQNSGLFEAAVGDILFTPVSEGEDVFVIGPTNPSSYAHDGEIFYTPIYIDEEEERLRIRAAVRIGESSSVLQQPGVDAVNDVFINCSVSEADVDLISAPHSIRDELLSVLIRLGGTLVSSSTSNPVSIQFPDSGTISGLPSLHIIIPSDDGRQVQIAQLSPLEYMTSLRGRPNEYYIYFWEASAFVLTRRIIQNLLIHIDYENSRIGFADPLVEF